MMSFFRRIAADAQHACEDVYSSWIMGDDAGKSVLVTLIIKPQQIQQEQQQQQQQQQDGEQGTTTTTTTNENNNNNNHHPEENNNNNNRRSNTSNSSSSRSSNSSIHLGLTFIEINGRAYVKDVIPGSIASDMGIMSQDAVQCATVFHDEWYYYSNTAARNSSSGSNGGVGVGDDVQQQQYYNDEDNNNGQQQQQRQQQQRQQLHSIHPPPNNNANTTTTFPRTNPPYNTYSSKQQQQHQQHQHGSSSVIVTVTQAATTTTTLDQHGTQQQQQQPILRSAGSRGSCNSANSFTKGGGGGIDGDNEVGGGVLDDGIVVSPDNVWGANNSNKPPPASTVNAAAAATTANADLIATKYILEMESNGVRITYNELRYMLADAVDGPLDATFISKHHHGQRRRSAGEVTTRWMKSPIPTTIEICGPVVTDNNCSSNKTTSTNSAAVTAQQQQQQEHHHYHHDGAGGLAETRQQQQQQYHRTNPAVTGGGGGVRSSRSRPTSRVAPISTSTPTTSMMLHSSSSSSQRHRRYIRDQPRCIIFCFRRTRQRKAKQILVPQLIIPQSVFRLDDECDFASSLIKKLAPTGDDNVEPPIPDTWDEIVHDGTDWLLGKGSMLPPIAKQKNKNQEQQQQQLDNNHQHTTQSTNTNTRNPNLIVYAPGSHNKQRHTGGHYYQQQQQQQQQQYRNVSFMNPIQPSLNRGGGGGEAIDAATSPRSIGGGVASATAGNVNNMKNDAASRSETVGATNDLVDAAIVNNDHDSTIPLDTFEIERANKLSRLRARMAAEASMIDRSDDVEAATIRGMIQKAVGLAFVRASKIVLGVSIHGGSGIVISRLSDGTWSAPSAIGTWGIGLGIQFGLEVAEYIFILQTVEALEHFKRSDGSFTVGGNMGVAIAGLGREAYGAASVAATSTVCGNNTSTVILDPTTTTPNMAKPDDEYNNQRDGSIGPSIGGGGSDGHHHHGSGLARDNNNNDQQQQHRRHHVNDVVGGGASAAAAVNHSRALSSTAAIAPIVAYAKSQGLYIGVSLEGSRIFAREEINSRSYKFATGGKDVTADDILSGKVPTPSEAEELYAALHSVEFTHEMSCLPRPPEVLQKDSINAWNYDHSTLVEQQQQRQQRQQMPQISSTSSRYRSSSYNNNSIMGGGGGGATVSMEPFSFLSNLTQDEAAECEAFETSFKNFMYGGVSVQRLVTPSSSSSSSSHYQQQHHHQQQQQQRRRNTSCTLKERRTLWLMLPEVGSLRLGFVSKVSDGEGGGGGDAVVGVGRDGFVSNKSSTQRATRRDDRSRLNKTSYNNNNNNNMSNNNNNDAATVGGGASVVGDVGTVASDELTLDSALKTQDGSTIGPIRNGNVQLSNKHSVALTDVTVLSHEPHVPIRLKDEEKMEHLRIISIQDVAGTSLLFLANNFREAELLVCGLKLLLERETTRLGVRGGLPLTAFGARNLEGAMSPSAARGFRDYTSTTTVSSPTDEQLLHNQNSYQAQRRAHGGYQRQQQGNFLSGTASSGYASSDVGEDSLSEGFDPRGRQDWQATRRWGSLPGRDYMRGQAATVGDPLRNGGMFPNDRAVPQYIHGQRIMRDIATDVCLPLPLPLCRVLLLDSTSPVIAKWENDRGDRNFEKTSWAFPPATPRELERHSSEHRLIASGSMCGAHRTISFDRNRYGSLIRLSETHTVDADDSMKVAFTVTESSPRRGFSIKVHITLRDQRETSTLRDHREASCNATVCAEIRPVGKDMSNQAAVHKAFLLVLDEIRLRYGVEENGLLSGFLSVVDDMTRKSTAADASQSNRDAYGNSHQMIEEKKTENPGEISARKCELKESGLVSFEDMLKTGRESPETITVNRPSTPSLQHQVPEADPSKRIKVVSQDIAEAKDFAAGEEQQSTSNEKKEPVLIEVKPLPKIRLSLMPSPREEDEKSDSSASPVPSKPARKKRSSSRKSSRRRRIKVV